MNAPNEDGDPTLVVDGVQGEVTSSEDGTSWFFTPTSPLSPSTAYSATFSYCRGDATFNFTTSSLGEPLEGAAADLVDTSLLLNLEDGRVVIPEGVGAVLEPYLGEVKLYLKILSADATDIEIMGAVADSDTGAQDYCSPTLPFPEADFTSSPYFQLGPDTLDFAIAGYEATIQDMLLAGTVGSDGTWIGGMVLEGRIDTRPLVEIVFDDEDDPGAICDFVLGFGISCIECSDGDADPYCLDLKAVDFTASAVDLNVETIELEDCHEECADTWNKDGSLSNPECTLAPVDTDTDTTTTGGG